MPDTMDPRNPHGLYQKYELTCTWDGCGGKRLFEQAASAGLVLGSLVPEDPSEPTIGRCPRCKRCKMKVTGVPTPAVVPYDNGFTNIPTE